MIRRLLATLGAAAIVVIAAATPAWADPARPTNYESRVDAIDPPVSGVAVEVTGGDAFLAVEVDPGTEVIVAGYDGEPYIRIDRDGEVAVNQRSPARWLNDDRYARVTLPAKVNPDAEPEWVVVAEGGSWAWHDHRIHWMSPDRPGPDELPWSVPLRVDAVPVAVVGTLRWHDAVSPLPWALVVAAAGVGAAFVVRRGVRSLGITVAAAGMAATVASVAQQSVTPAGAGGELTGFVAALAGTGAGVASALLAGRVPSTADTIGVAGAVVLVVWGLVRIATLWMPVLPTPLAQPLERVIVAVVIGVGAACVAVAFGRRLATIRALG